MVCRKINLEHIAIDVADFAHSQKEPTSVDKFVIGRRPYYYMWSEGDLHILTFERSRPQTARIFKYSTRQICNGIYLDKDTPAYSGAEAIKFLQNFASRRAEVSAR